VPQSLNRYAATSLGQVGVGEGAGSSFLTNAALTAVSNTPSAVVGSLADSTLLYYPTIQGNKTNLLKAVRNPAVQQLLGDDVVSTINNQLRGKTLKQLGAKTGELFSYTGDTLMSKVDAPTGLGTATISWEKGPATWRNVIHANGLAIGVGIDMGVSALFEIGAPYWGNPYLSGGQKIGQFGFKLAGYAGASIATYYTMAWITSGITLNPVPLVIATIGVGTMYGFGSSHITDFSIDQSGANQENRKLQPLGDAP